MTWTSSNPSIVTVNSEGWVNAKGIGTATITATTWDGKHTATCTVTVTSSVAARIEMVQIPAGTFTMGSPPTEKGRAPFYESDGIDEGPQHQVTLSAFYMGKYEVTQKQWYEVMGKTVQQQPYMIYYFKVVTNPPLQHFEDGSIAISTRFIIGDNYPMYLVGWYDTLVFCNRLSMQEGLSPAYSISGSTDPSDWGRVPDDEDTDVSLFYKWDSVTIVAGSTGYRLPTEAQWEYACRAGTTTPFNTGNNLTSDQAAYGGGYSYGYDHSEDYEGNPGILRTRPMRVGSFAPNAWGLYDMHGNVREYCWDLCDDFYPSSAQTDPTGPIYNPGDWGRVTRGGSWYDHVDFCRSAFRMREDEALGDLSSTLGFRVVRP